MSFWCQTLWISDCRVLDFTAFFQRVLGYFSGTRVGHLWIGVSLLRLAVRLCYVSQEQSLLWDWFNAVTKAWAVEALTPCPRLLLFAWWERAWFPVPWDLQGFFRGSSPALGGFFHFGIREWLLHRSLFSPRFKGNSADLCSSLPAAASFLLCSLANLSLPGALGFTHSPQFLINHQPCLIFLQSLDFLSNSHISFCCHYAYAFLSTSRKPDTRLLTLHARFCRGSTPPHQGERFSHRVAAPQGPLRSTCCRWGFSWPAGQQVVQLLTPGQGLLSPVTTVCVRLYL